MKKFVHTSFLAVGFCLFAMAVKAAPGSRYLECENLDSEATSVIKIMDSFGHCAGDRYDNKLALLIEAAGLRSRPLFCADGSMADLLAGKSITFSPMVYALNAGYATVDIKVRKIKKATVIEFQDDQFSCMHMVGEAD
jgi:hypothetical protein